LRPEPAGLEDPAGEHGTIGLESLAGHDEAELVEPAVLAQVRAGEGSVRQVEVSWMGGLRTISGAVAARRTATAVSCMPVNATAR